MREIPMEEAVPTTRNDAPERYTPPAQEVLQHYEINIQFLSRGCIVRVGCKSIAFENVVEAMQEINDYVANPDTTQQKWRKLLNN